MDTSTDPLPSTTTPDPVDAAITGTESCALKLLIRLDPPKRAMNENE